MLLLGVVIPIVSCPFTVSFIDCFIFEPESIENSLLSHTELWYELHTLTLPNPIDGNILYMLLNVQDKEK